MLLNKRTFALTLALPLLILVSLAVPPVLTWFFGEEINLTTEPVDPKDLFRGDYVRLEYSINTVGLDKMPKQPADRLHRLYGQKMYAVLKQEGDVYTVDYVTLAKPAGPVFIKCTLQYLNDWQPGRKTAYLDYHLDRFFVPENTGQHLEELARQGQVLARVKVFKGHALLVGIAPRPED